MPYIFFVDANQQLDQFGAGRLELEPSTTLWKLGPRVALLLEPVVEPHDVVRVDAGT